MKTKLLKKYRRYTILTLLLLFNLCINFTSDCISIGMKQIYAQDPEGIWDTGCSWFDNFMNNYYDTPGTYFNNGNGDWSYCPDCMAHVNLDEVIVYGVDMSNTPIDLNQSNLWHSIPTNDQPQWSYWNYTSGVWSAADYTPLPTIPPPTSIATSVVSITLSYTGQFTRDTERPVELSSTVFDCSAWVYFVLLNINNTLANRLGSSTSSIKSCIASSKEDYHPIPLVGDLAVWDGHVEFVVGYDGTFVTISGSRGSDGGAVPTNEGDGWLKPDEMTNIAPDFIGFWTIEQ